MANKYTTRNLLEHNFDENNYANLVEAAQNKANAVSAVANYGDPKYARQQDIESVIDAKLNQGKFSYDINGDALYQQYKENYINQGKQAMMDTMGQAAAMTGGYGNSYAATVGNQTYQGYLQNLNNMIPQLQQMALDRYNAESNRLTENLNVLNADKANYLSEWELGLNKRLADRDYYGTDYANLYKNTLDLYDKQFTANNEAYWNEYEAGYKAERDSIEDERYAEEADYKKKQVAKDDAKDLALSYIGAGVMPNAELLKSAGISSKDAKALVDKYNASAVSGTIDTSAVSDNIKSRLGAFENDFELSSYINDLVESKTISKNQAKSLYAEYKKNNVVSFAYGGETTDYYVVSDGGKNGGGGVDKDAEVMMEDGNIYTMKQIADEFGNDYAVKLQKKLKIHD